MIIFEPGETFFPRGYDIHGNRLYLLLWRMRVGVGRSVNRTSVEETHTKSFFISCARVGAEDGNALSNISTEGVI